MTCWKVYVAKCDSMKFLGVTGTEGFPLWLAFPLDTQPGSGKIARKFPTVVLARGEKQQTQLIPFPSFSTTKGWICRGVSKDFKDCSPWSWWSPTAEEEGNEGLQNKTLHFKGEAFQNQSQRTFAFTNYSWGKGRGAKEKVGSGRQPIHRGGTGMLLRPQPWESGSQHLPNIKA